MIYQDHKDYEALRKNSVEDNFLIQRSLENKQIASEVPTPLKIGQDQQSAVRPPSLAL